TIVVYDRIRENAKRHKGKPLRDLINLSINEMLGRTILTSGATALSLLGLILYGVGTIQDFALAMLVGIISGTYSTWYIASPMTLAIQTLRALQVAMRMHAVPDCVSLGVGSACGGKGSGSGSGGSGSRQLKLRLNGTRPGLDQGAGVESGGSCTGPLAQGSA